MSKNDLLPVILEREAEKLRQEKEIFDQRKGQESRWFILRLVMGYSAVGLLGIIMIVSSFIIFHHDNFPNTILTLACSALFVDVVGLLICVWKIVLNPSFMTKLEPATSTIESYDQILLGEDMHISQQEQAYVAQKKKQNGKEEAGLDEKGKKGQLVLIKPNDAINLSNWTYKGDWKAQDEVLIVTNSVDGGIYKQGVEWKNYTLRFEFKIVQKCCAWIVRAMSLDEFFMIQCDFERIRPHFRTSRLLKLGKNVGGGFQVLNEVKHNLSLKEWNKVETNVLGDCIVILLNNTIVWKDEKVLHEFKNGTIGFRCANQEHSLFKEIELIVGTPA